MKKIKLGIALLLIAALVVFVLQNLGTVQLKFLGWESERSLAFPVIAAYFVGGLTARFVLRFLNARRKERKLGKEIAEAGAQGARRG